VKKIVLALVLGTLAISAISSGMGCNETKPTSSKK
jgi:hypothetical protein